MDHPNATSKENLNGVRPGYAKGYAEAQAEWALGAPAADLWCKAYRRLDRCAVWARPYWTGFGDGAAMAQLEETREAQKGA